jgi:hypothetical protein
MSQDSSVECNNVGWYIKMMRQQSDLETESPTDNLFEAIRSNDIPWVTRSLERFGDVAINHFCPDRKQTPLGSAASAQRDDAVGDLLLAHAAIKPNLCVLTGKSTALHRAARNAPTERLIKWMNHPKFDIHIRDSRGCSILEAAMFSGNLENVRAILNDGRVKPSVAMLQHPTNFYFNYKNEGVRTCFRVILKHVARRIADDFQNLRRVGNAKCIPGHVVGKMLGFVHQDVFPVGYDFNEKLPWRETERCILHEMVKDFIRLFGNVDDFVWPQNEIESEPVPAMDQIRTNQSAYSLSSGSSRLTDVDGDPC